MGRDLARRLLEEAGRATRSPVGPEAAKPIGLNVEREDQRILAARIVHVSVRFPGIDQNGEFVRQRRNMVSD